MHFHVISRLTPPLVFHLQTRSFERPSGFILFPALCNRSQYALLRLNVQTWRGRGARTDESAYSLEFKHMEWRVREAQVQAVKSDAR